MAWWVRPDKPTPWIAVMSPYRPDYVTAIKQLPSSVRAYVPTRRMWMVAQTNSQDIIRIIDDIYGQDTNNPESRLCGGCMNDLLNGRSSRCSCWKAGGFGDAEQMSWGGLGPVEVSSADRQALDWLAGGGKRSAADFEAVRTKRLGVTRAGVLTEPQESPGDVISRILRKVQTTDPEPTQGTPGLAAAEEDARRRKAAQMIETETARRIQAAEENARRRAIAAADPFAALLDIGIRKQQRERPPEVDAQIEALKRGAEATQLSEPVCFAGRAPIPIPFREPNQVPNRRGPNKDYEECQKCKFELMCVDAVIQAARKGQRVALPQDVQRAVQAEADVLKDVKRELTEEEAMAALGLAQPGQRKLGR